MEDVLNKLNKVIPQFVWRYDKDFDKIYGYSIIDAYVDRDDLNNILIKSNKHIHISNPIEKKDTNEKFRYCLCYQKSLLFEDGNFIENYVDNIFIYGNDINDLYINMFNKEEFIKFIVTK